MVAAPVRLRSVHGVPLLELCDFERCILPGLNGNKARKLASLCAPAQLPAAGLVSHGGPQSNAMLALAALTAARGASFTYHTKPLPRWLRDAPTGNLGRAQRLGMSLCEHTSAASYEDAVRAASGAAGFVPQGGAWPGAEEGVASLAREIGAWRDANLPGGPLRVVVPAGTGTTGAAR